MSDEQLASDLKGDINPTFLKVDDDTDISFQKSRTISEPSIDDHNNEMMSSGAHRILDILRIKQKVK
jgi:hypothetical protein